MPSKTLSTDTPLETLPISAKYRNLMLFTCGILILTCVLQLSTGKTPFALLPLLPLSLVLVWCFRGAAVQVFEDGIEIKEGPLAKVKFAAFEGLASVRTTKKAIFLEPKRSTKGREIKITRLLLQPADQDWLLEKLEYEMASA